MFYREWPCWSRERLRVSWRIRQDVSPCLLWTGRVLSLYFLLSEWSPRRLLLMMSVKKYVLWWKRKWTNWRRLLSRVTGRRPSDVRRGPWPCWEERIWKIGFRHPWIIYYKVWLPGWPWRQVRDVPARQLKLGFGEQIRLPVTRNPCG